MHQTLHKKMCTIVLGAVLLLATSAGWAQQFKDGIRQGMVKVKFTESMSAKVSTMDVRARATGLTTGIAGFDAAARTVKATNMYRLFPYDEKFEHKLRKHGLHLWYVVEIDQTEDPRAVAQTFSKLSEVAIAEVEREKVVAPYKVTPHVPSAGTLGVQPFNDPLLKDQWHYHNEGQSGYVDADINLFPAWQAATGAGNIVVAVHDQGVDVAHEDLKANIWINTAEQNGVAGVDDDGNGYVDDINGYNFEKNKGAVDPQYHGTHVAGTIAAVNNNGKGVSGIAGGNGAGNGVKIMSLQILGGAPIEKSYVYAANNGAVVSQNSWGYTSYGYSDQSVIDAIDYFIEEAGDFPGSPMKGGIVLFAAGNSNSDGEWYPGYYDHTLAVAAIGPEWKKASYSNYGEWVEISAPGGDQDFYSATSGVLSTIPNHQYAYMQGTSMACPHVSGIAALALANRDHQLTSQELWNKLVTGVVDIYAHNPDYIGKLGSGAIDATLAIRNDQAIAPAVVADLSLTGIAQEFATFSWSVPSDADDDQPVSFNLYYATQPLTASSLADAEFVVIENNQTAGSAVAYELQGLLGLTQYYFGVTAADRWGNVSALSNIVTSQTNEGPSIVIEGGDDPIQLTIDAGISTAATQAITVSNEAEGILRWDHFMRHSSASPSFDAASVVYPSLTKKSGPVNLARRNAHEPKPLRANEPAPLAFSSVEISYADYPTNIIGETDTTLNNSAGARFYVSQSGGFNLTDARIYLKHDPAKGDAVMEVYRGEKLEKKNLVYAQNFANWSADETYAYITLNEQIYFEEGETFWLVFHVPHGNLFPLGIGYESDPTYSANCVMSFNLGATWSPLEELINSKDFAWTITAASYNAYLGEYLTLEPGSGDISGIGQTTTTLTASGAALVNGTYSANVVFTSNDANQRELRKPVELTVSGHQPDIHHIDIVDFGNVFVGTSKELEIELDNAGYGNFNNPSVSVSGTEFELSGYAPWQIKAREKAVVKIIFHPTAPGNSNDVLTITNGTQTYEIPLFGVGAETAKIVVTPDVQVKNNLAIGDAVDAQITVRNDGAYPLKYFIPGHDTKDVSNNWPVPFHTYGYAMRTNDPSATDPITYAFQDISTTGTDITDHFTQPRNWYWDVDMGFEFPYYNDKMTHVYVSKRGFTTFDNTVNPINTPRLKDFYGPQGYISVLGSHFDYTSQGKIYYQVEPDRVIIQYSNVWDGYSIGEEITAQMVLYADGNIRFFYDNVTFSEQNQHYLTILMEDMAREDGILISDYEHFRPLYSQLAIGFDYPGPDIITSVTNGSGIVMPGSEAVVDLSLTTTGLVEGTTNRYVSFISNDPSAPQTTARIQLEITSGGVSVPVVSLDTVRFGDVFQHAVRTQPFTIRNPGSANVNIVSMAFTNNAFTLGGDPTTVTIRPGLYNKYEIQVPTATLGAIEDWLTISYGDGSTSIIYLTANVVDAPSISVDLSQLAQTLNFGETSSHPLTIENTGLASLDVAFTGKNWMTFDVPVSPSSDIPAFTYSVDKSNDGQFYQWLDVRKTGTQMPHVEDFFDKDQFWQQLELPFPIQFYGESYSSFKVGQNGLITLEEETPEVVFFTDYIPSAEHPGKFIMPYWTFGGFDTYTYPVEEVGIFYQFFDDRIVIMWSYLVNNFGGMGDPVSVEAIFYKNGTMKFQYQVEGFGNDLTSGFSTIGVQLDSVTGVLVSAYAPLDHGNGLAYTLVPVRKYTIAPGETLTGNINLDARNVYGGVYNEALKIQTNVPGSEMLEKPVELTVAGDAELAAADTVDFGSKMIAFEWGSAAVNSTDLVLSNTGSASMDITWAQMADGTQGLSLMMLADGWFGPEWTDIANIYSPWAWETPVYAIKPGDNLVVRAIFYPSTPGDFLDEVVLTTSVGEQRIVLKGTAFNPPALNLDNASVEVAMNTPDEVIERTIAFDNINGYSPLEYTVNIDYGRILTDANGKEKLSEQPGSAALVTAGGVKHTDGGARVQGTYNRVATHTDKEAPDTFVGTGGAAPFTVATRYNGGPEGFNVTHVETWFRVENVLTGAVQVEVRAGGTSIANAKSVSKGIIEFTGTGSDEGGTWYAAQLDAPAAIYPNEDFYVLVTYPLGISFPVGTIETDAAAGRYYYMDEGVWYDLQEASSFEEMGWLMYAGEETAVNAAWLSVTSATDGSVEAGESDAIALTFTGANATRGDQVATVVIHSNDPDHVEMKVPVTLHLNEAPHFGGDSQTLFVAENENRTVTISVTDTEEDTFTVAEQAAPAFAASTFADGVLTLVLSPQYGDAGQYTITWQAKDAHDAIAEHTVTIDVAHTNQAPVFVGDEKMLMYATKGRMESYLIQDYFDDPDNDAFIFTVTSQNPEVAQVFADPSGFIVKPGAAGEAMLRFTLTDSHGATTQDSLRAVVNIILGVDETADQGLSAYPNPVVDYMNVSLSSEWTGDVLLEVVDAAGRVHVSREVVTGNSSSARLNLATLPQGLYLLRASAYNKEATFKIIKK